MNKTPAILVSLCLLYQTAAGQVNEVPGRHIAEIFTDFHFNINDTSQKTGFSINRAQFGYQYLPQGDISGEIILDIASPEDLAEGSIAKRYAHFREASVTWTKRDLSVTMGITGTGLFEYQQKFWGKRYLAKPYQSLNGYGFVADLGVAVDYKINDKFLFELNLMNGEGYSNLQLDNNIRTSVALTVTPNDKLYFRFYGDIQKAETVWQPMFIGFAGIKIPKLYFGGEFSYKSGIDCIKRHNVFGLSATGGVNLTKKTELFCRVDFISSVIPPGESIKWNHMNDGSFIIPGVQYTISQYAKIAIDYQGRYPYDSNGNTSELIYINASFKF